MNQIKNIGGIGSIFALLGIIPTVGPILVFAGFIMVVIAIYKLSQLLQQKEIFRNYLIAVIFNFLVVIILFFGIGTTVLFSLRGGMDNLGPGIILAAIFAWLTAIISAYFVKKSFMQIGQSTGVAAFKTAGKLHFLGNILLIILVGAILSFIAAIMQIIAFFELPQSVPGKPEKSIPTA